MPDDRNRPFPPVYVPLYVTDKGVHCIICDKKFAAPTRDKAEMIGNETSVATSLAGLAYERVIPVPAEGIRNTLARVGAPPHVYIVAVIDGPDFARLVEQETAERKKLLEAVRRG